jgi:hypothetical protein
MWIGFSWLRTETGGGLLGTRRWNFGFRRHGISYLIIIIIINKMEELLSEEVDLR